MLDTQLIDAISIDFTTELARAVSDMTNNSFQDASKTLDMIEQSPVNFLEYAAEVAQRVFKIRVLRETEFSDASANFATGIIWEGLAKYKINGRNIRTACAEDRLVLFFAGVAMVTDTLIRKREVCEISDETLEKVKKKLNEIKFVALAYRVSDEDKVREWFDGSGMPL